MRNLLRIARRYTVHVDLFSENVVDVDGGEVGTRLRQLADAHLLREHGSSPEIGNLKRHCRSILVLVFHKVSNLIVNSNGQAGIEVEPPDKIVHRHHEQVEIVHTRRLNSPIDTRRHEAALGEVASLKCFRNSGT